jgi:hypothetical protein
MDNATDINDLGLRWKRGPFFISRPAVYILIVIFAVVTAYGYKQRTEGIFSCQGDRYTVDQYLAYCNGADYGDYEHGAFWFGMDASARSFAKNAEALFVGNSRLMVAFSTPATTDWFSSLPARYYLLGFSYDENVSFTELLLQKIRPQPQVYVVNFDGFFDRSETPPAKVVVGDPEARNRYEVKRLWQLVHEPICNTIHAVCGNNYVVFRSRQTGAYSTDVGNLKKIKPVTYDAIVDDEMVKAYIVSANEFLSSLHIKRECIILTIVPTVDTKIASANAVANAVGLNLVTPGPLVGLQTIDGSHLDKTSAERWSRAFFQTAGGQIQKCLNESEESSQPRS